MKLSIAENKKQIKDFLDCIDDYYECGSFIQKLPEGNGAKEFYELLKQSITIEEPLPEKSAALLSFMQEHKDEYKNLFTSAAVATAMGTSGKSIAGSMRSLVSKGYVEKIQGTPVVYSLVECGE